MKLRIPLLCALSAGLLGVAAISTAQVYKSTSNKHLGTLVGNPQYDGVFNVKSDASGNRFVLGWWWDGSDYQSYLAKLSKKGFVSWIDSSIQLSTDYYPVSVAPDASGNVYVCQQTANSHIVQQFLSSNGGLNYTGPEFQYPSYAYDMVVQSDGSPVVMCDFRFDSSTEFNGLLLKWSASGSGWIEGFYNPVYYSHFNSVAVDPSGGVYAAGYELSGEASPDLTAIIEYANPDFTDASYSRADTASNDDYYTEIKIDPYTNVAVAVGGSYPLTGGFESGAPLVGTHYIENSSYPIAADFSFYPFSVYAPGAIGSGVTIADNGQIAMSVATGIGSSQPAASVYAMRASTSTPADLFYSWERSVPATDTGSYAVPYDIATDANGFLLAVVSDLTIGLGSSAYRGIQAFTFDLEGNPLDRSIFGSASIATQTGSSSYDFPRNTIYTTGGYLSIFGAGSDDKAFLYTSQLKKGPNDSYRVDEDEVLTVGAAKSVLNNDGNQFTFGPMTCALINSSVSAGIHSLTLNPDGTFNATFNPNFNGIAKFNYRLKQGSNVIATNHVTINVKAKNDAPTAVADTFSIAKNSAVTNLNVLANDSDIDGDDLTIFNKTNNANATIGITADKKFITFKPKPNFTGDVTFQYTIRDPQGLQSTATVTVHVS